MTTTPYALSEASGVRIVSAFIDGEMVITDEATNPHFDTIVDRLDRGDTVHILDLFHPAKRVERVFSQLSTRVSVNDHTVYFDGDPVENDLSDHLLDLLNNGEDIRPLLAFWENIAANPSEHSREHLLRWLRATNGFTITFDGMIIGYRGVSGDLHSIHSGYGIVNGVEVDGFHDNSPGNIISMPRSMVDPDSNSFCSVGLHVGTWEYARNFGSKVVEVRFNPRDVVSVPSDSDGQKMRVCRFEVLREVKSKYNNRIYLNKADGEDYYDEDDGEY